MPNFSADERRTLSGEELELAVQSRQPRLRELSDAAIETLLTRLRAARDAAQADGKAGTDDGAAKRLAYLTAALRRASRERSLRRKAAGKTADAGAKPVPERKAEKPAMRKPATRSARKPRRPLADRRGAGARKLPKDSFTARSDIATSARNLTPKATGHAAKADEPPEKTAMTGTTTASPTTPAPAGTDNTVTRRQASAAAVQELAEKAANRARKAEKARKKAKKAAKRADESGSKKDLKAAAKAQKKARKADRKAQKSARRARKAEADPG